MILMHDPNAEGMNHHCSGRSWLPRFEVARLTFGILALLTAGDDAFISCTVRH